MVLWSVKSIQGNRDYMEDRYVCLDMPGLLIALVCDGHGGHKLAHITANKLPLVIKRILDKMPNKSSTVDIAQKLQAILLAWGKHYASSESGTTLTGVVIKNGAVFVVNIGDSRTCIRLKASSPVHFLEPLFKKGHLEKSLVKNIRTNFLCTIDHDLISPKEIKRLRAAGGVISDERLNGILSLSRALGDHGIGKGLSFVPDIWWFDRSLIAGPILMFSDGVYEPANKKKKFSNATLYAIANKFGPAGLVGYAYASGSDDNITALSVLHF